MGRKPSKKTRRKAASASATSKRIGIDKVATIFGLSTKSMRAFKERGIIKPCDRIGNKHLYDRRETEICCELWRALRAKLKTNADIGAAITRWRQTWSGRAINVRATVDELTRDDTASGGFH